jgi:hypothetical protein
MSDADAFLPGHDHDACVADLLDAADRVCDERSTS